MIDHQRRVLLLLLLLLGPLFAHSLPVHLEKRKSNALSESRLQSLDQPLTTPSVLSLKGKNEEIRNQSNAFDKFRIITDPTGDTSVDNQHQTKAHHKTEPFREYENDIIPGEFLVQLKTGLTASMEDGASKLQRIMDEFETEDEKPSIENKYEIGNLRIIFIKGSSKFSELLAKSKLIESISPNRYIQLAGFKQKKQWNLKRISSRAPKNREDHSYEYFDSAGKDVDVYVIDTGIDVNHKEFEGRARCGYPKKNCTDKNGHGTFVAGIIGSSTYGVAKKVNLIAVKVFADDGTGSIAIALEGIKFVSGKCKDSDRKLVANISLGTPKYEILNNAVSKLLDLGVHVVVAAGNENTDACMRSPASARGVLVVGAVDENDKRATFSNFGKCVSLFAPGEDIESTFLNHSTKILSGTSYAAPHVSGIVALLLSQNPGKVESVEKTFERVKNIATKNRLSRIRNSVNLLAYNGFVEGEEQNPAPSKPIDYSDWSNLGEDDFISEISKKSFDVNQVDPEGVTPLRFAISSDYQKATRILLDRKAEVNADDTFVMTQLFFAIEKGRTDIAKLIIEKYPEDCKIDFQDKRGFTALHFAVIFQNLELVKILLEKKASIDQKTKNGETPLYFAILKKNEEIAKLLIDKNADILTPKFQGRSLLLKCIQLDSVNIAKMLIEKDRKVLYEKFKGDPLLFYVKSVEMAQLLIKKADSVILNEMKHVLLLLLEDNGKILRSAEFRGKTLLQLAIFHENLELANLIIDKIQELKDGGIEYLSIVNAKCASDKTAWDYAKDFPEIANRLKALGAT